MQTMVCLCLEESRNMEKVVIIGGGVMGSIFCEALNKWDYDCNVTITNRNVEKLEVLKDKYPHFNITENNVDAIRNANIIILAVKPQGFDGLGGELKGAVGEDTLIISIMAGITIEKIKSKFGVKKVVRAMPNLGARVNKSMTVWTASNCNEDDAEMVSSLFVGIGKELCVDDEEMIDKATAVSGSGPGFFFYILEQWLESIEALGFNKEESKKLLLTTVDGSVELLKSDMDPGKFAKQVASKGGTTEAGFKVLDEYKIQHIWSKVLQSAENRAKELSDLDS